MESKPLLNTNIRWFLAGMVVMPIAWFKFVIQDNQ
jgi:hypothetical protein